MYFYIYLYFSLFITKNIILTINAKISANTTAIQIPFTPQIAGSMSIIAIWNSSVLKNEIAADTIPLFSAVKNDELNMLNPLIKYDIENILIAFAVMFNSSIS